MRRRVTLSTLLALAACALPASALPASASASVKSWGYLDRPDGTRLRYVTERPAETGRFPVVLFSDYYSGGTDYDRAVEQLMAELTARGFAVVGVSVRGTACSSGVFDFFEPGWVGDMRAALDFAGTQPWSSGKVGMVGISSSGLLQFFAAAGGSPHLAAIAPAGTITDLYRDGSYPGGIQNTAFAGLFTAAQKLPAANSLATAVADGDTACAEHFTQGQVAGAPFAPSKLQAEHPWVDEFNAQRSPERYFDAIRVPTLLQQTWQDEQVGARGFNGFERLFRANRRRTWLVASNGNHSFAELPSPQFRNQVVRFLERYVAGIRNGWKRTPRVQLWFDSDTTGAPGFTYNTRTWPVAGTPIALYLHGDGTMSSDADAGAAAPRSYRYPGEASSVNNELDGVSAGWTPEPAPDGRLVYTTRALGRDLAVAGPASLDLWLGSTATDTDLQATLAEVRPDGREVYVQRGWLRTSHRKLDRRASTVTRPLQTHLQADAEPLTPGVPTPMRLEVFPFAHMFRKGSAIRISIEAPTGLTGLWGFSFNQSPATNTVYADAEHPSRLVLKVIPKLKAGVPLPACDTVRSQPCRSGTAPVPPGTENPPLPSRRRRCRGRSARIVLPKSARRKRLTVRVDGRATRRFRRRGRRLHVRLRDARVAHRVVVRFRVKRRWKTRKYLVAPCRR
jgi:uncharacterized protein